MMVILLSPFIAYFQVRGADAGSFIGQIKQIIIENLWLSFALSDFANKRLYQLPCSSIIFLKQKLALFQSIVN